MSPEQVRGMERFQSAGCTNCHSGPMFSDSAAHVLAVPDNQPTATGPMPNGDDFLCRVRTMASLELWAFRRCGSTPRRR